MGDVVHEFGIIFGSGAPAASATAGAIAGIAVGDVVALFPRRNLIEAVVPLAEVGSLVASVGRFEHAWDVELLAVLQRPSGLVFLVKVARGGLANLDAASGGAAEGSGGVALGEAHKPRPGSLWRLNRAGELCTRSTFPEAGYPKTYVGRPESSSQPRIAPACKPTSTMRKQPPAEMVRSSFGA